MAQNGIGLNMAFRDTIENYLHAYPKDGEYFMDDDIFATYYDFRGNGTVVITNGSESAGHPGGAKFDTGASTGSGSAFRINHTNFIYGGGKQTLSINFNCVALATVADDYYVRIGYQDQWIFNPGPNQGVFFEYNRSVSVNWLINTANGGAITQTDTGIPVTAGWHRFRIVSTVAPLHQFYLDDVFIGSITTNTPTNQLLSQGIRLEKTAATGANLFWWDYLKHMNRFTTAR